MALVSHTIVSRYTPQTRDPVTEPAAPDDDPWQAESSFGPRLHSRAAPYFVPALLDYDEYGMPKAPVAPCTEQEMSREGVDGISTWYRSLTGKGKGKVEQLPRSPSTSNSPPLDSSSSSSLPKEPASGVVSPIPISHPLSTQKPNWFATHPLPNPAPSSSAPSTLADLLSRNPPPLPSEPAFKPPVFLALGPGNRGYTMLERKGWQEGEGLGSARIKKARDLRRKRSLEAFEWELGVEDNKPRPRLKAGMSASLMDDARQEIIDLTLSDSEEHAKQEVVDLTLSDTESETEDEPGTELKLEEADDLVPSIEHPPSELKGHGTTLLTPIATTLKADRLGIGLKAVRRKNAKAKAVTHTSAALAAHIRTGNRMRKEKKRYGRGSRGIARSKRREERERIDMLAYMKL